MITEICRDCFKENALKWAVGAQSKCAACGSHRFVSHPEMHALKVAHIDCDAFYASVEKRDHPELQHVPLIIGGRKRGVVTTACYLARIKGVRSAMPMFKALKLCPEATVVSPNFAKYVEAGRAIRKKMYELTDAVQPLSIDEAFLDLSDSKKSVSPLTALLMFAAEVESEFRLSVSVGLSHNKLMAKIASDCDKPRGLQMIGKAETLDFLADKPVSLLWGVGKATANRLAKRGINTVAELRQLDLETLKSQHGSQGERLYNFARGMDTRRVAQETKTKSISTETTFSQDVEDGESLQKTLAGLCERLSERLLKARKAGTGVTLKLKTKDFQLLTRSQMLTTPTCLPETLMQTASALLIKEVDGRAFRLMGVGAYGLAPLEDADWGDLADPERVEKYAQLVAEN